MIKFTTRIINLVFGLFLYALGAAVELNSYLVYGH